ncbi:MAG: M48 family metallopeptidase [Tissierellia bacterium]|nr:M48 family metallopeptidase [Tissierellia bacterium]
MNSKLLVFLIIFFVFLILFIGLILVSEYRNMDRLKIENPTVSEKNYSFRKAALKIWAVNLVLKFLFPLFLLTTGLSNKIVLFAEGKGRGLILTALIYVIFFSVIDLIISLPTSYGSFLLRHRYGLSNQSIYRWIELILKNFALNTIGLILAACFLYYLMRLSPTRWWLYLGLLAIPIITFIMFISPTYIDPIFNKYTAIEDESLREDIKDLLDKAGVGDANIFVVDKSKDTNTLNAYMTGVFSSKRIVLWDTTINKLERDEIISITAHEIGHYVLGHIWKGIILGGAFAVLLIYLIYKTSTWILINSNGSFGFNKLYSVASLPLLIFVLNFYMFFANPIVNLASRHMEREADAFEINLTKDREAAISTMIKLSEESLSIPRPSKIYKIWYYTHPPVEERIEFFKNTSIQEDNP